MAHFSFSYMALQLGHLLKSPQLPFLYALQAQLELAWLPYQFVNS